MKILVISRIIFNQKNPVSPGFILKPLRRLVYKGYTAQYFWLHSIFLPSR